MPHVYVLELTASEVSALEFAGGRYLWVDELINNLDDERGAVVMTEGDAWNWVADVESDMEGGHEPFPLAAPAFVEKLYAFMESIV